MNYKNLAQILMSCFVIIICRMSIQFFFSLYWKYGKYLCQMCWCRHLNFLSLLNVSIAYQIHLTISVIVACVEISFLKLKLLKTFATSDFVSRNVHRVQRTVSTQATKILETGHPRGIPSFVIGRQCNQLNHHMCVSRCQSPSLALFDFWWNWNLKLLFIF